MNRLVRKILNNMDGFSRSNPEPFKVYFPYMKKISKEDWTEFMEHVSYGYEPIYSVIKKGEYGNCILIIFTSGYFSDSYLQWTYVYKGLLLTEYFHVPETIFSKYW